MPNTPVPAAGEAMPAAILNRRAILTGSAATAAALAATSLPAESAAIKPLWERIDHHLKAIIDMLRAEAHGAFDTYYIRSHDGGPLEGFAFVNNEDGNGATHALYSRLGKQIDASPIRLLFQEWEQVTESLCYEDRFLALNTEASNAEMDRLCSRQNELTLQMTKLPCRDSNDFAMKVIAVTGDGEFALDDFAPGILADARAVLAGGVS